MVANLSSFADQHLNASHLDQGIGETLMKLGIVGSKSSDKTPCGCIHSQVSINGHAKPPANPTLCPPIRLTISCFLIPFLPKNSKASATEIPPPGKSTSLLLETKPSRRPVGTTYLGPPARPTASLVAMLIMSAHDTVEGHAASTACFASSITSNPLTLPF
ncbi:hypothetical protein G2W53_024689 [Senna tora]|uniref:Uncharacterized protein n=1 Tax=Senna tora TaxID=362788 RepID=A0A834TD82_9FABA|nr:hypothetical protein G2W53_024689 [Senna tora]